MLVNNSLSILIITKYATSKKEGFEGRTFALARRFVEKNNNVTLITSDSNHFGNYPKMKYIYNYRNEDSLNINLIRTYKYIKTVSFRRILSWIDFEIKLLFFPLKTIIKPDVIIVSSLSLLTILNGIRLKNKYNAKLIFEIRDIWPLTLIEEGGYRNSNAFVKILSLIEKYGYLNSDLVIGTMPNLNQHLKSILPKYDINCKTVPFGFDQNSYIENTSSTIDKNSFNIPNNKFIIGYAGSIGLSNGLDAFIDSIIRMQFDKRFYFILLGEGAYKDLYLKKTIGLTNVCFIPKLPKDEVGKVLNLCDILYFSSLNSKVWHYGWSPNKLIDYMISGKPILASYSGFRSMLNESNSGFFIPAEDSNAIKEELEKIINIKPEILKQMGISGKQWLINNREWGKIANLYLNIMNDLVSTQKF
jgi:glycosyltransferase involved in cell wall biosynthesis